MREPLEAEPLSVSEGNRSRSAHGAIPRYWAGGAFVRTTIGAREPPNSAVWFACSPGEPRAGEPQVEKAINRMW
jgi:hypothetical protein